MNKKTMAEFIPLLATHMKRRRHNNSNNILNQLINQRICCSLDDSIESIKALPATTNSDRHSVVVVVVVVQNALLRKQSQRNEMEWNEWSISVAVGSIKGAQNIVPRASIVASLEVSDVAAESKSAEKCELI